jgi:predicted ATPase with chaperone activity
MRIHFDENTVEANTEQSEFELFFCPEKPTKIEDIDISRSVIKDLILRFLYTRGSINLRKLGMYLKLPFSILHELFQQLRQNKFFEVMGMKGNDYIFTLSGIGREMAEKLLSVSHYCGPAPVSLNNYRKSVISQITTQKINRKLLTNAFSELVLTDNFLDQLGPALSSQKSIFLYGPTGNGKTSVANRLTKIFENPIVIPYAVEVDGQIISLYDPRVHERLDIEIMGLDDRWVVCRRPCIIVGGELESNMLELQIEESTKVYNAPLQMKANNGILIIDDFGRQIISPTYLLNRWIVPLDRRVDYLSLSYGLKFEIPFEVIVIFSTNLDPSDLADEAFLRRIPNKICVDTVSEEVFEKIFQRVVEEKNIPCDTSSGNVLKLLCLEFGPKRLSACYPSDIIDIIASISAYEASPVRINRECLERAAKIYFTKSEFMLKE